MEIPSENGSSKHFHILLLKRYVYVVLFVGFLINTAMILKVRVPIYRFLFTGSSPVSFVLTIASLLIYALGALDGS